MRVRKALQLSVLLSAMAAVIVLLVFAILVRQVERAVEAGNLADRIVGCIFERSTLRDDYVRTNAERARIQWEAKHEEILRLVGQARKRFWRREEQRIIDEMMKDSESSEQLFRSIVAGRRAPADAKSARARREAEDKLLRLSVRRAYDTVLHARGLQEASSVLLLSSLEGAGAGVAVIIAVFAVAGLLNAWVVGRNLTRRVAALSRGASLIGAGNLDHRISMTGEDDFTEVAGAFDAMAENLQSSYRELEREIAQRKRAEEALRRNQDELELRVAERTEEIERIREELERQNKQLQSAYHELEAESETRVRAVQDLREKEHMLIQQGRLAAMGEMLGHIAHQWRQPLNSLGLLIQQLALDYECGALNRESLDGRIEKSMEIIYHLSQTITDFSTFAAPDKKRTTFRLRDVIAKTISLIGESFKTENIALEVVAGDAPEVKGYPNQYVQVLLNILMNARDALHERRVAAPRVRVQLSRENERGVVVISDNAGGIPEHLLERIFDPYFTTKEPGKGTGIGLFMSKTIIEKNMGGRLTVINAAEGAEFRIEV